MRDDCAAYRTFVAVPVPATLSVYAHRLSVKKEMGKRRVKAKAKAKPKGAVSVDFAMVIGCQKGAKSELGEFRHSLIC